MESGAPADGPQAPRGRYVGDVEGLYFAYGSNLVSQRMRSRVPSASALGRARLPGMRLTLDKHGADGTGKANLAEDPEASVWGVVYALDPLHWPGLDACEPGYVRIEAGVEVDWNPRSRSLRVETYVSHRLTRDPVAHAWYRSLLVEGAREHGLPEAHVAMLERLRAR